MSSPKPRVIERVCIACRQTKPRGELFRLVRPTNTNDIVINPRGEIGGKGFYLCRSWDCLKKLNKNKRLHKNFSSSLSLETLAWLEEELKRLEQTPQAAPCSKEVKIDE